MTTTATAAAAAATATTLGQEEELPVAVPYKRCQLISSLKSALFVLGTAIVVFAAARNTITWHLQQFWGASGDFWERQWGKVYTFCDGNEFTISVMGTTVITAGVYWFIGGLYTVMDLTGKPAALVRYKIQPTKNKSLTIGRILPVILQVLFNQTVVGLPFAVIAIYLLQLRGYSYGPELPTFHWVLMELVIFTLSEEVAFYYSHRFLHRPTIYKFIHKQHHEWTSPIAVTAIYTHPLEHVLSNLCPIFLGPLLMGSHIGTIWLWSVLAYLSTLNAHSGYHLPLMPSPEAHDFHHLTFTQNFGILGVLDRLHGTDAQFRASKAYERHVMLLSLVPLVQSVPNDSKSRKSSDADDI